jgi:hypothetical protein
MTSKIEVSEHGDTITLPEHGFSHELRIRTDDPTAQIEVLDDRFRRVFRAAGSAERQLPAGLYKVRIGRGASAFGTEDKLVVLDHDVSLSIEPPQLYSPAPIPGTRASEAHVAAFKRLDEETYVNAGTGSKIAVLARYVDSTQGARPVLHPFRGLQLLRADGPVLVDLEPATPKAQVPDIEDPVSICGISVAPGYYILRHQLANGRELRQSIVASEGWQITVNIRRTPSSVNPGKQEFVGAGYMALLMRRLLDTQSAKPSEAVEFKEGSKNRTIDEDRLIDVARQALADGVPWLRGSLYDLLLQDFKNPLAGIIGGLLLDIERELADKEFARRHHAELFDGVVRKLRAIVGGGHPDAEALSFRCVDPSLAHKGPMDAPPMFYRSWRIILEAASTRHDLVPLNLWRTSSAWGAMPPYLVWSAHEAAKKARFKHLHSAADTLSTYGFTRRGSSAPDERDALSSARIAAEVGVPANAIADLLATKAAPDISAARAKPGSATTTQAGSSSEVEGASKKASKRKASGGARSTRRQPAHG